MTSNPSKRHFIAGSSDIRTACKQNAGAVLVSQSIGEVTCLSCLRRYWEGVLEGPEELRALLVALHDGAAGLTPCQAVLYKKLTGISPSPR